MKNNLIENIPGTQTFYFWKNEPKTYFIEFIILFQSRLKKTNISMSVSDLLSPILILMFGILHGGGWEGNNSPYELLRNTC